jgi:hypothetical protein
MMKHIIAIAAFAAISQVQAQPVLSFNDCVEKALTLSASTHEKQLQDLHHTCLSDEANEEWRSILAREGILDSLKNPNGDFSVSATARGFFTIGHTTDKNGNYVEFFTIPVRVSFNGNAEPIHHWAVQGEFVKRSERDDQAGFVISAIRLNVKK